MKDLHKLNNYDWSTIKSFVDNSLEEDINIDFKAGLALSKDKRDEITKDVAAFANADGGIIVYGVSEKDHVASGFSFVDATKFTKEWLDQVINTGVKRNIPGIKIFPVRENDGNDFTKTVYVVQIPLSIDAPHMNREKKYYRRLNTTTVLMEEYEVRRQYLYERKAKSKMDFLPVSFLLKDTHLSICKFYLKIDITNCGETVIDKYKVNIYLQSDAFFRNIDFLPSSFIQNKSFTNKEDSSVKFSSDRMITLFPGEGQNIFYLFIAIKSEELKVFIESLNIKAVILYEDQKVEWHAKREDLLSLINN